MTTTSQPLHAVWATRKSKPRGGIPVARFKTKEELLKGRADVQASQYARASSNVRQKSMSVADKLEWGAAVMARHGWTVAGTFSDDNKGASYTSGKVRDGYEKLCELIDTGVLDVLVIFEISRQARDLEVYVELRGRCMKAGLFYWQIGNTVYDLRDKDDRLHLNLNASIAEHGGDSIREHVQLAIASKAREGKPHGKAPFGFTRTYDKHTRKLVQQAPDSETVSPDGSPRVDRYGVAWSPAEIVRSFYSAFLAGTATLLGMADELNGRGIPCPRLLAAREEGTPLPPEHWAASKWTDKSIRDLMLNPAMIGQRVINGELAHENAWTPMVDEATFITAAARLLDPKRKTFTGPKTVKYLLSGIAKCGVCGWSLTQLKANPNQGRYYPTYKCRSRRGCVAVEAEALEERVVGWFIEWLIARGRLEKIESMEIDDSTEAAHWRAESARLQLELEELRATLDDTSVSISLAAFDRREKALLRAIEEADSKATVVSVAPSLRRFRDVTRADQAAAIWDALGLMARREIVADLVDIRVMPVGRGRKSRRNLDGRRVVLTARLD